MPESDSILTMTKKLCNVPETYDVFDLDFLTYINANFATLHQLGVGPQDVIFQITGKDAEWSAFIGTHAAIGGVKSWMGMKTRLAFDPPSNNAVLESLKGQISELEFRLMAAADDIRSQEGK